MSVSPSNTQDFLKKGSGRIFVNMECAGEIRREGGVEGLCFLISLQSCQTPLGPTIEMEVYKR